VALFVGVPKGIVSVSSYGDPSILRPMARDRRLGRRPTTRCAWVDLSQPAERVQPPVDP